MLWQKDDDSLYIDLSKKCLHSMDNFRFNSNKNDVLSDLARKEGNEKYSRRDFKGAMDKYNECIRLAEDLNGLSIGYANRSSCFFSLEMYDRCLIDIELAKNFNYPEHLMYKLNNRKQKCLDKYKLEPKSASLIFPKLSCEADEKLKCISNALQIDTNREYGRLIRAKRNIEIGETILIEEAYVHKFYSPTLNKCTNCERIEANFIPCKNCNGAMFCSETCLDNAFHEIECDMVFGANDYVNGESLSFILRSVIIAIKTFDTIKEMMKFVDDCLKSDHYEVSTSVESSKMKYRTFFKLSSYTSNDKKHDLHKSSYIIFKAIMGSKLAVKFETTAAQRFLFHLIAHHAHILRTNSFGGFAETVSEWNEVTNNDYSDKERENRLHLITSYFNHSCLPNTIKLEKGTLAICKTLLPIKKGEQLFLTYIQDEAFRNIKERVDHLKSVYGFQCKCHRCTSGLVMAPQIQDSNFKYVRSKLEVGKFDMQFISEIKERCITFILKYPQMAGSVEFDFIVSNFGAMLQKEIELM